jgi:hypothetical protein
MSVMGRVIAARCEASVPMPWGQDLESRTPL